MITYGSQMAAPYSWSADDEWFVDGMPEFEEGWEEELDGVLREVGLD